MKKNSRVNFVLTGNSFDKLNEMAKAHGCSKTSLIREALKTYYRLSVSNAKHHRIVEEGNSYRVVFDIEMNIDEEYFLNNGTTPEFE